MKDILYPLRRLHGSLHEDYLQLRYELSFVFPLGRKFFILGTPRHSNLGDSAIVIAQIEFLHNDGCNYKRIKEVSVKEYRQNRSMFKRVIGRKDMIFLHGGGNIGTQWPGEDELRFDVIQDFPKNRIILFPQSAFFSPDEKGDARKRETVKYYDNSNMTLTARERNTYALMQELYPHAKILLTPDIVLSADAETFGISPLERSNEVLFCFRDDLERALSERDAAELKLFAVEQGLHCRMTDTHKANHTNVTVESRRVDVRLKLEEFARARLVLTDRLHGMVFAAITGTPCIVLDNNNHKVQRTYEWIQYLPYVRYADNIEQAEILLSEMLNMGPGIYDNNPLREYYNLIREVVRS